MSEPGGPGPVLQVEGLRKSYDDKVVLAGVDLVVERHDVVCLIGGAGLIAYASRRKES